MEKANEQLTSKIVIEFAKTIELFDLTPLEARLFAYLYLIEDPMTLDEMSEVIGKSKTSMSTSIRSLLDLNLVTRVWKKGVRKDLYKANSQLFKTFMNSYINKWIDAANNQQSSLQEIKKNIDAPSSNSELQSIYQRLTNIMEFHSNIEKSFRDLKME
ncbi:transcriptional regulator [Virgibacillus phasianinus]|uniref:HTH-type transcriptional regulator n=1 Tax=Virgibacillus phasianinus TaxID=2017483 RepID=A0A220TYP1_9BACI|nr:helix-turn-helix domain-containing protein [Virgibacillus phasianinus]ASK60869.1 transcriptional regulator [Virgibacillus phasianinus]